MSTKVQGRRGATAAFVAVAMSAAVAVAAPRAGAVPVDYTITATPSVGVVVGSGSQPISPIVLKESVADAIHDLYLTFTVSPGTEWDRAVLPSVTVSGGQAAVASKEFLDSRRLAVRLEHTSSSAPATFTVSGLRVLASAPGTLSVKIEGTTYVGDAATYGDIAIGAAMKTRRIAGAERYATAANAYAEAVGGCNNNDNIAVLARGDNFADALAANYLAGRLGTGIMLTEPGRLPTATVDRLRTAGVHTVYVVGGRAAVSQAVRDQLAKTASYLCEPIIMPTQVPIRVVDVPSGEDRYGTAAAVAAYFDTRSVGRLDVTGYGGTPLRTAVLAGGLAFADALAAGPMVYSQGFPLLLTAPTKLSSETVTAIRNLGIGQVIIVGGPDVVSRTVEDALETLGVRVIRLFGTNRQATAAAIAQFAVAGSNSRGNQVGLSYDPTQVVIARGDVFADALAIGPVAGKALLPLLLTSSPTALGGPTSAQLAATGRGEAANPVTGQSIDRWGPLATLTVVGGTEAVSEATLKAALDAAATR